MEKIPYKPGDVLVNRYGMEFLVQDLSKNELVCFLKDCSGNYSFEELEETGLKLKSSKEELCDCLKFETCFNCIKKFSFPWRPEAGQKYFYLDTCGSVESDYKSSVSIDLDDEFRYKSGNCFRTREEAEEKLKKIMEREV